MADHDDLHGHESADNEYLPAPDAAYERTDASVGAIAKFMAWLAGLTVLTAIGMGVMFATMADNRIETAEPRYPLADTDAGALPEPAGPRLQTDPALDMERFRRLEDARLESYRWLDEDAGTVRIPIEEAMRMVVEQGLPVAESSEETGLLPSDSSAGRMDERRRQ